MTWLCFCFDFTHSHARCGCCSIVCLRFQDEQIKQFDCKMNTKIVNNYNQKSFCDIFGQLHTKKYKATEKQTVRFQLNFDPSTSFGHKRKRKRGFYFFKIVLRTRLASDKWIKSMERKTKLMSWYWGQKPTCRKDLITCNSHPWIMFYFNWLVINWRERRGVCLKLDVQG